MEWPRTPFEVLDFSKVAVERLSGESAWSEFRQLSVCGVRMRIVDYAPGYLADHWCEIGHFGYVLEGAVSIELRDKEAHSLKVGEAFLVSTSGDAPHRLRSDAGAKLLLVD